MSLLLDALKRAEQAKQAAQGENSSPQVGGSPAQTPQMRDEVPQGLSLQEIDEPPRKGTIPPPEAADRESVRNVFASKQAPAIESSPKPAWLPPLIAVAIAIVGGGSWYVWKEVSKGQSGRVAAPAPAAPKPVLSAAPSPTMHSSVAGKTDQQPPVQGVPAVPMPSSVPLPDRISGSRLALTPAERAREDLAKSLRAADKSSDQPVILRLSKGIEAPRVSEALAEAYTALKNGNSVEAKRMYAGLVSADASNLDARLGLATALARTNDTSGAVREYKKALEIDPRNGTALAALLMLTDTKNMPGLEMDLRALLNRFPDSAALSFALGNLLASQSRWTEAQQAYFDAWRQESDNSDYAFNLAVSLDQIRQVRLAMDYYQRSLSLASIHGAQFDRKQAERRLNELKSTQAQ